MNLTDMPKSFSLKPSKAAYVFLAALIIMLTSCATTPKEAGSSSRERTLTVTRSDQDKEQKIKTEIITLGDKTPLRAQVKVFNNQVLLVGEVTNLAVKQQLEVTAARTGKVSRVFNRLTVVNPLPQDGGFSDLLLKARVVFALARAGDIDTGRIEYLVDRERVFLMGLVTQKEADLLIDVLRQVSGVKEVVVAFNYI